MNNHYTKQSIFDRVAHHLKTQGRPALNLTYSTVTQCMYRTPEGLSCAVGCLIEDPELAKKMDTPSGTGEGTGVESIAQKGLLPKYLMSYLTLLNDLQQVHDDGNNHRAEQRDGKLITVFNLHSLAAELADVAKSHDLNFNKERFIHGP